jgi:hypothetical protein
MKSCELFPIQFFEAEPGIQDAVKISVHIAPVNKRRRDGSVLSQYFRNISLHGRNNRQRIGSLANRSPDDHMIRPILKSALHIDYPLLIIRFTIFHRPHARDHDQEMIS